MIHHETLTTPVLFCRWHRLGLSVKGDTLTVIDNCQQTDEPIRMGRTMPPLPFEKKGVVFVGYQVFEEELYTVSANRSVGILTVSLAPSTLQYC